MRYQFLAYLAAMTLWVAPAQAAQEAGSNGSDFTATTCDQLAQESDESRAFALIFYYGYLAGRTNATVIDNTQVAGQLAKVRDYCMANPDSTVIGAFVAALK